jgi:hypothetical protein
VAPPAAGEKPAGQPVVPATPTAQGNLGGRSPRGPSHGEAAPGRASDGGHADPQDPGKLPPSGSTAPGGDGCAEGVGPPRAAEPRDDVASAKDGGAVEGAAENGEEEPGSEEEGGVDSEGVSHTYFVFVRSIF